MFFALLFRLKYINRWGLMRSFRTENLSEHSLEAAVIAHALAEIGVTYYGRTYDPAEIALLAIYHDVSEIFTGDMPSPVKYYTKEMKKAYKSIEDEAGENLLATLPNELRENYAKFIQHDANPDSLESKIVKAADRLCAYIKCVEETGSGNREFSRAKEEIYKTLDPAGLDEFKYFMENFLPYFESTVDEIKNKT